MNAKAWFYSQSFNGGTRESSSDLRAENARLAEENRLLRVALDELARQLEEKGKAND